MEDIRTQMKPIKIGKFTILVEKIKTIYSPTNISIYYCTELTKDGKFIGKDGDEVHWGSEAKNQFFSKNVYNQTMKDIKQTWEIELQNLGWI